LEVTFLRIHHFDEKDWLSLTWDSRQSDVECG
jgi:hypothetical protein